MLRRSANLQTPKQRHQARNENTDQWNEEELLQTFEPLRKKWSPLKLCLCFVGACILLCAVVYLFRSGEPQPTAPSGPVVPPLPEGKKPVDMKSILYPIPAADRCKCRKCNQWREFRKTPWLKPRKENYVKGCSSHLMEWHQVTSPKDGHTLPGPGRRFQSPGVICDICQEDFAKVGKELWAKQDKNGKLLPAEERVLHSWTCYKCIWEDPDRFHTIRDPKTGKMTKKHVINHGVDVCGVCAEKCPDQIRTFTELGPEGKLLHPGHPGDHLTHNTTLSLIGEMRKKVKDEL